LECERILGEIQQSLLSRATKFRNDHTFNPSTYEEFQAAVEKGFAFSWWCGGADCETKIKEDTKATARCIPFEQPGDAGRCIVCGKEAPKKAYFGKAY
jgi:prolyl-tRNA synthetase